jgi:Ca2+-binding EF-hand superfamily protein
MDEILQKYRITNLFAALIVIALTGLLYYFVAQPYQLTLGATTDEIRRPMPGDELVSAPHFRATRAITIQGTPEEIWPWLLQMGHNRAGYYAYDILENIGSEQGLRSAEEIIPEFQNFQQGDEVPISAVYSMVFYAIEPNQYLVWTGKDKNEALAWALYPVDDDHTRLVSRIQLRYRLTDIGSVVMAIFVDTADHIAVRKILQGVKGRVEGQIDPVWVADVEFVVFMTAFGIFVTVLIALLVRPLTWTRWLAAFGAGIGWLAVWYAPIWF